MASSVIKKIKSVNDVPQLSGSSIDLDNLINTSDSGLYYIQTGVQNTPATYSALLEIMRNGYGGQLIFTSTKIFFRLRTGNPLEWKPWRQIEGTEI